MFNFLRFFYINQFKDDFYLVESQKYNIRYISAQNPARTRIFDNDIKL